MRLDEACNWVPLRIYMDRDAWGRRNRFEVATSFDTMLHLRPRGSSPLNTRPQSKASFGRPHGTACTLFFDPGRRFAPPSGSPAVMVRRRCEAPAAPQPSHLGRCQPQQDPLARSRIEHASNIHTLSLVRCTHLDWRVSVPDLLLLCFPSGHNEAAHPGSPERSMTDHQSHSRHPHI